MISHLLRSYLTWFDLNCLDLIWSGLMWFHFIRFHIMWYYVRWYDICMQVFMMTQIDHVVASLHDITNISHIGYCNYWLFHIKLTFRNNSSRCSHQDGVSPLLIAASLGHVECLRVLLEKGANIEIQDEVNEESYSSDSIVSYLI